MEERPTIETMKFRLKHLFILRIYIHLKLQFKIHKFKIFDSGLK